MLFVTEDIQHQKTPISTSKPIHNKSSQHQIFTQHKYILISDPFHKPVEMAHDRHRMNIAENHWIFHLPAR